MPVAPPTYIRLEPHPNERNSEAGFAAAIHDPVWFLGRQWQMGEHQGENASSPTWVDYEVSSRRIAAADPRFNPVITPAEAIVESEINDWWTMGRRVRIGRRFVGHPALSVDASLSFYKPPPPYERFHGQPDGLQLWRWPRRAEFGITDAEFGADLPPDSTPVWDSEHLLYQQNEQTAFSAGEQRLTVQRHRGGRLDWHSVDATAFAVPAEPAAEPREAIPTTLNYPGAPNSRWWQIENADVDLGGYVPDSAHTTTAFLTDLIFSHSDDWFLFPVLAQAGGIVAIESITVRDAFGRIYSSTATDTDGNVLWPGLQPPPNWTLFKVDDTAPTGTGLAPNDLVLWHVAELPLESIPLERVQFGIDEESNLLWAVERIVDGREVESRNIAPIDGPRFNNGTPTGQVGKAREYAYVPGEGIAPRWHPYTLNDDVEGGPRRLIQRRIADLSRQKPVLTPPPEASVLQIDQPVPHTIAPLAVPSNGIEVERRWMLARDMYGLPVLWIQRQRRPLLAPPARRLRFDVMEEAADPS